VQGWKPLPISAFSAPVMNLTTLLLPLWVLPKSQKTGVGARARQRSRCCLTSSSLSDGEKGRLTHCHTLRSMPTSPSSPRTRGQGDRGTRRQKQRTSKAPQTLWSPCPPVSLSPCHSIPDSPGAPVRY